MKEMFEASVDGEAYDMERWGQYFKPAGMSQATGDPNRPAAETPRATPAPAVNEDAAPWEEPVVATPTAAPAASTESASRAQDILAMIRNRQK
jgi:hypothetical protein